MRFSIGTALALLLVFSANKVTNAVTYEVIVVGGGFAGVSSTYYINLVHEYSRELGITVPNNISLSYVLLLEESDSLGGNAKTISGVSLDNDYISLANQVFGTSGNKWNVDLGLQRTPQLTAKLDRVLTILTNTVIEQIPYMTYQYSRGRRLSCPEPDFTAYSPSDPWGISGSCTNDPLFTGYSTSPLGAFNLTEVQLWARKDPLSAVNSYLLYGDPNPVTCPEGPGRSGDGSAWCVQVGCSCFSDVLASGKYKTTLSALIGELGVELTELWILDFGGFFADFLDKMVDPKTWVFPYWNREYDTNAVHGYVLNGTSAFINNLAKPIKEKGTVKLNNKVTQIEYMELDSGSMFYVKTNSGETYVSKRLILAVPPSTLLNQDISGSVTSYIREQAELKSVYCVSVVTITVELHPNETFWHSLVPKDDGKGKKPWVLLRAFGDQSHISRIECRHSIGGNTVAACRFAYNDLVAKDIFEAWKYQEDSYPALWNTIKNDVAYAFQVPRSQITDDYVRITVEYFDDGWCYVNGTSNTTNEELKSFAQNPSRGRYPVCLAHQAYDVEYLGWKEGSLQSALRCVDRFFPHTQEAVDCIAEQTFPSCDCHNPYAEDWCKHHGYLNYYNCYNNPDTHISGTETVLPSIYCNERFWMNDFNPTPGCVQKPTFKTCVNQLTTASKLGKSLKPLNKLT